MPVTTAADDLKNNALEHLRQAAIALSGILVEPWGHENYNTRVIIDNIRKINEVRESLS